MRFGRLVGALALALSLGCGSVTLERKSADGHSGRGLVVLTGADPVSEIYVDEIYLGTLRMLGGGPIQLRLGRHRLEVRTPGRYPWRGDIDVQYANQTVNVMMIRVPGR